MSDFVLYQQDVEKLGSLLRDHVKTARVLCAFLTNKEGLLLSCEGATDAIDTVSVAALITGSFNATVTIANLIGEAEFTTMFHRGKNKHIHITLVDQDRYLASVFDNSTTVQKVNYYAIACGKLLREYLLSISGNAETAFFPDEEDGQQALDFDQVFEPLREAEGDAVHPAAAVEPTSPEEETHLDDLVTPPPAPEPKTTAVRVAPPSPKAIPGFLRRKMREARALQHSLGR